MEQFGLTELTKLNGRTWWPSSFAFGLVISCLLYNVNGADARLKPKFIISIAFWSTSYASRD